MTTNDAARFYTREQCGLYTPNTGRLGSRTDLVTSLTLHCTGSTVRDPLAKWLQIQQLAMAGQLPSGDRYGDHPYNYGLVLDGAHAGAILPGRDLRWKGAHATSTGNIANRTSVGIAIIGNGETFTAAADKALAVLIFVLAFGTYKRGLQIFDHLDWAGDGGIPTACPGRAVIAKADALRKHVRPPFPR